MAPNPFPSHASGKYAIIFFQCAPIENLILIWFERYMIQTRNPIHLFMIPLQAIISRIENEVNICCEPVL